MAKITLIFPYYENAGMLLEQQRIWNEYPQEVKDEIEIIVVDDCSPNNKAIDVVAEETKTNLKFSLYRTLMDIRWNWIFCRNLGVEKSKTNWLLMCDIDHVIPASTLSSLINDEHQINCAYLFTRLDYDGSLYKTPPNIYYMHRDNYEAMGGYDERFSGYYGTDHYFRDQAKKIKILKETVIRYGREIIPDASTTTYERKTDADRINVQRIWNQRKLIPKWKPLRVTFPYEQLI